MTGQLVERRVGPPDAGRSGRALAHVVVLLTAVALWFGSLPMIDLDRMDGYGLVSALPVTSFLAVVVLTVGFAWSVWSERQGRPEHVVYVVVLVVMLHSTVPLLYDAPRYGYVYKHIAVIRYILRYASVNRAIDIYHNWPGFFAANAVIVRVVGIDPLGYANWAPLFFGCCNVLALRFLAAGFTRDGRRIAVVTWVFVLTCWVEQGYLAPQAMAYFLALVVFGLVVRYLRPDPAAPHQRLMTRAVEHVRAAVGRRWSRLAAGPRRSAPSGAGRSPEDIPPAAAASAAVVLSAAIIISHQLTPFFLVILLGVLVVRRRCSAWWLPVVVALMTAGWVALAYGYLAQHFSLFSFDVADNVQATAATPGGGSFAHRVVGLASHVLTGAVASCALLAWWAGWRRGDDPTLLVLGAVPVTLVLVQSYGGEGIYRIYIFALPWLCLLVAKLVTGLPPTAPVLAALVVGNVVLAGLFLTSYFGYEQNNRIPRNELAAAEWFERNAPPGSVLSFVSQVYPSPLTERYWMYLTPAGNWGGDVFDTDEFIGRQLGPADVERVERHLLELGGRHTYVALGPTEANYAENYGFAPPGAVQGFSELLLRDPDFRVVFQDGDAAILELVGS